MMADNNKNLEAEEFSNPFYTKVSVPGVLDDGLVQIDMDEVCFSTSKVQYLKANFIDALGLQGTPTEYRLIGEEEQKEREIDENSTIQDIFRYVRYGRFIMEIMPKQK